MKIVVYIVLLVLVVVVLMFVKSVFILNVLYEFEDLGDGSYEIVSRRKCNVELNFDVLLFFYDNFSYC